MTVKPDTRHRQRTSAPSDGASVRALEESFEDTTSSGKGRDWRRLNEESQLALSASSARKLANELKVDPCALIRLGMGFHQYAYTFPMVSAEGEVVGIRTRPVKGGKQTLKGGRLGLFIPDGVTPGNLEAICEGESDTLAALTLGIGAIGIPCVGQAVGEAVAFARQSPVACPCVMADNGLVGREGAEEQVEALLAENVPCRLLFPPEPFGDLREWLIGGLTGDELRKAIESQPIRWPDCWPSGFFQVPNSLLRNGIVHDLGAGPFALLCALGSFHGGNGQIHPSREELAKLLGVSVSNIDLYKRELKKAGMLTWTRGRPGWNNDYKLNFGPLRKSAKRASREESGE